MFHHKTLAGLGITDRRQINAIADMAYVTWPAHEKANSDAPYEYWPRITEAMNPEILERQARWHALPVGWEQLDYATFLERRRQLIARVVQEASAPGVSGSDPRFLIGCPVRLRASRASRLFFSRSGPC